MQIIVDANPLISVLISPGKPIELFFIEELDRIAPEFLFIEVEKNLPEIIEKSKLSKQDVIKTFNILKEQVKLIPENEFVKYRKKAKEICPNEKDIIYFALAIHMKCPLWSNEKQLKTQDHIEVYATHELIKMFKI